MELTVLPSPAEVDHVVVNALFELDAARDLFSDLGFCVSERGYHSLGSMNHLIMAPGAYLELVGVPREGLQRADVLNSPLGLSGLVLKSEDAEQTFADMQARGLAMLPPLAFSRPVSLGGQEHQARFKIVRSPAEQFPAGRIYFCQHLTPELVWSGAGLNHANGFRGLLSTRIESTHLAAERPRYLALTSAQAEISDTDGDTSDNTSEDPVVMALRDSRIALHPGGRDCFASVQLEFDDLAFLEQAAQALAGVQWQRVSPSQGLLHIPALALRLECVANPAPASGQA